MRVLIATDSRADDRKTAAAVRSLAASGVRVAVGGDDTSRPVFREPGCAEAIRLPRPVREEPFLAALECELARGRHHVLLPFSDDTTIPVVEHRARLERHVRIPVPDPRSLGRTRDKLRTLAVARRLGLGIPRTAVVRNLDGVRAAIGRIGAPCVLKPRRGAAAIGVAFLEAPEDAESAWQSGSVEHDRVYDARSRLLQERIPGEVHDVCVLFRRGEPRAVLTQWRVRMEPPAGGPGVLVETTRNPELAERAVRLMRALRWHGPAQVEFRLDPRDGEPKLLEVNGRYWGTLGLAIRAGVDFPRLACRMALDGDVEPVTEYGVGVRMDWRRPAPEGPGPRHPRPA